MKDSGVEWIGDIPEGWEIIRNKRVMRREKEICQSWQGEPVLSLSLNGIIERDLDNPSGKMPTTFDGYQYIRKGGLLLCLFDIDVTPRCVGLILQDGVTSPAYSHFRLQEGYHAPYYYYYYLMLDYSKELLHLAKNIRHSFTESQLGEISVIAPSYEEQQRIADFLDTQTAAIDASITKTRESIGEYKKLKQAVITQAVTKGIRPGRTMKDSGVEWIGDIPEEWGCIKVKYVTSKIGSGKTPSGGATTYLSEGVRFLRSQNIYNEGLVSEGLAYISAATDEEMKSTRVLFNDVLLNITGGSIGRCCTYPDDTPANVNQHVCIIRCVASKCIAKYMQYCWNSDIGQLSIKLLQNSANREGMSGENISNTFITYPALPEQQEIAAYLDEKCAAIDTLIEKKQQIITELDAYKKSLIYEYVTGKKEVPMAT